MTGAQRMVRIHGKGQLPLPAAVRRRLNLKTGDMVALEETATGVLLTPQITETTMAIEREHTLFTPPTPEELARRQALLVQVLKGRKERDIRPLTSADLVHLSREDATVYDDQSN
jgi:AbrB family looped-hinge helix DNA binding protein